MQITTVLLSLVATAAAVDIRAYTGEGCRGGYAAWVNTQPGKCYGQAGNIYRSIGFAAIPIGWNLNTMAYDGSFCSREIGRIASQGRTDTCHSGPPYSGAKYVFIGKKRQVAAAAAPIDADSTECNGPEALVFEDGTQFDIQGLDNESSFKV